MTLQRSAESGQQLSELERWVTGCLGLGATLLEPPRQESFGVEAWLADPEANRLLLLVL